jgi:hypothetical protein
MNNLVREKLKSIITQYGCSLADNPKRCEALLRDFCGQYRKEINVLIGAIREGVPTELLNSQNSIPSNLLLARLTKKLEAHLGLSQEAAKWGVESWAIALGIIFEEDEKAVKPSPMPPPVNPLYSQEEILSSPDPYVKSEVSEQPSIQTPQSSDPTKTDLIKEANKKIRIAWMAGCASGGLTLASAIGLSIPELFIDVVIVFGLSFGIYKKSRVSAGIMVAYFIISKLLMLELMINNGIAMVISIVFTIIYIRGMQGTFQYHKIQAANHKT